MAISLEELRNGLAPGLDVAFPRAPQDPTMRESTSIWMFDEAGRFGFPRLGIETEGSSCDACRFQANFAFADGRVLDGSGRGPAPPPIGPGGRPTILGAGPLVFQCIEPFRRWMVSFHGPAIDTRPEDQLAGAVDPSRRVAVRLEADLTMVTPAWTPPSEPDGGDADALAYRFEQLFHAEGTFTVDGMERGFAATGLRIHRQGLARLADPQGHCRQSAVFPDGRAFGYVAQAPGSGRAARSWGYIYQDGRMIPARVTVAPWLRPAAGVGDDVSFELESELGRTRIAGSTTLSAFGRSAPDCGGLVLQQSGARYVWDDQSAIGMVERSALREAAAAS